MKRQLLCLFAFAAMLACVPFNSAHAIGGVGGHGHGSATPTAATSAAEVMALAAASSALVVVAVTDGISPNCTVSSTTTCRISRSIRRFTTVSRCRAPMATARSPIRRER